MPARHPVGFRASRYSDSAYQTRYGSHDPGDRGRDVPAAAQQHVSVQSILDSGDCNPVRIFKRWLADRVTDCRPALRRVAGAGGSVCVPADDGLAYAPAEDGYWIVTTRSGMGGLRPVRFKIVDAKFRLSHGSCITFTGMPGPASIQTECVEMRKKAPWLPPGFGKRTLKFQWSDANTWKSACTSSRRLRS